MKVPTMLSYSPNEQQLDWGPTPSRAHYLKRLPKPHIGLFVWALTGPMAASLWSHNSVGDPIVSALVGLSNCTFILPIISYTYFLLYCKVTLIFSGQRAKDLWSCLCFVLFQYLFISLCPFMVTKWHVKHLWFLNSESGYFKATGSCQTCATMSFLMSLPSCSKCKLSAKGTLVELDDQTNNVHIKHGPSVTLGTGYLYFIKTSNKLFWHQRQMFLQNHFRTFLKVAREYNGKKE